MLSHRPAGAAWGICSSQGRPEVTIPRQRRPRPGIVFHRSRLPADERTVLNGIPITTVPRTLLDLAATLDERQLERAINEAEIKCLWDELSLDDLLHRYPRRPGTGNVRAALRKRNEGAAPTKSDLEELFIRFADRAGLARPETNVYIEGLEVDCVWRAQRVIIEVDSWEIHRTRSAFERDREKSRILQAAGWRCVPVTYLQLKEASGEVARGHAPAVGRGGYPGRMRLFGRRRKTERPLPTYSNEAVIQRIQQDAGIDRDTARTWFNEMLVFLDLVADSRDFISPPGPVDAAWHAFILHTRDYEAYCRERFGRVIHHEPTGEPDPKAYRRAYDRRARHGQPDPMVWAVPALGGGVAATDAADRGSDSSGGGDFGGGSSGGGDFGGGSSGGGDWGGSACGGGGGGGGGCGGGGG